MTSPTGTQRLLDFDPNWCLFWGAAVAGFQLDIWIPYIRRSRYRFAIMSGVDGFSDPVRERVEALPNCIIIEPYEEARASLRKVSGLKGFLYIGTREENFRLVNRFGGKLHIWLGHGESDKIYNAFRTASLYDSMFVARYAVTKRYPRAIRRWVAGGACAIGTPIVEGLVKDPWARPRPIRTILYAPTWEGGSMKADYTSLPEVGPALLEALPKLTERGISVIMRPHPVTGRRRPELIEMRDAIFAAGARAGGAKTRDFAEADVIISDISGVTAEFLFTEKPAIMPASPRLASIGKDDARLAAGIPVGLPLAPRGGRPHRTTGCPAAERPVAREARVVGTRHVPRASIPRRGGRVLRCRSRLGSLAQDAGAGALGLRGQAIPRPPATPAHAAGRAPDGDEGPGGLTSDQVGAGAGASRAGRARRRSPPMSRPTTSDVVSTIANT